MDTAADTAPDLRRGWIRNHGPGNRWMTEIQAVLTPLAEDGGPPVYLSHECRLENVPFSSGRLGGGDALFQADRPNEFLTCTIGDRFYQLLDQGFLTSQDPYGPIGGRDGFYVNHLVPSEGGASDVHCPPAAVEPFDVAGACAALDAGTVSLRDLFLEVTFQNEAGAGYRLHAPSRYVNFDGGDGSVGYVQPISGQVVYRDAEGRLTPAYVACASDGARTLVEFATPAYRNALALTAETYETGPLPEPVTRLFGDQLPMAIRLLNRIHRVDGTFRLYRYRA